MKTLFLVCLAVTVISVVELKTITRIVTKTSDFRGAGTERGASYLVVANDWPALFQESNMKTCSLGNSACFIYDLDDTSRNDREQGKLDFFQGTQLMGCNNFRFSSDVEFIRVTKDTEDDWTFDWIYLEFSDFTHVYCGLQTAPNTINTTTSPLTIMCKNQLY
eukprot:TRINITY_DN19465_c0_g3_i7.p1 TRINITY_DN19465_c0_g3~~TRINITY_DN19465_c0_g3_i7.p1  ORF type:complete len:163 (-),score=28.24 TRINITY_DN19465_c0_g3_i7:71-559(-)